MDSFNQTRDFCYNPNPDPDGSSELSGVLEIYVHHARNIHNICIYNNQDVYAKFSLTSSPDETLSTSIINGGGKNPEFDQNLMMKIKHSDPVLKCEIWMLSRARNYLEDQLLGFALVPISSVFGKGKVTQNFSLSSTDLFHSPAGTVKLSLSLNPSLSFDPSANLYPDPVPSTSITSEVVLLDRESSEVVLDPVEYSRIEFPDINVVQENQQMVSEYFNLASHGHASFLHLCSSSSADDLEMAVNSSEDDPFGSDSPNGSNQNSGFLSSTTTSVSDDRNTADSIHKKGPPNFGSTLTVGENNQSSNGDQETPTSKKGGEEGEDREAKEEERTKERKEGSAKFGQAISSPLGNMNMEAEQSAMQKQIVDMYMKSMQQFTESLAKMKLPMDLDKPQMEDSHSEVIQNHGHKVEVEKKKKDGSRVFYGSRAFF